MNSRHRQAAIETSSDSSSVQYKQRRSTDLKLTTQQSSCDKGSLLDTIAAKQNSATATTNDRTHSPQRIKIRVDKPLPSYNRPCKRQTIQVLRVQQSSNCKDERPLRVKRIKPTVTRQISTRNMLLPAEVHTGARKSASNALRRPKNIERISIQVGVGASNRVTHALP